MTDPDPAAAPAPAGPPTILERMATVYGEDKAREWLASGHVQLAGEYVTDPDTAAPRELGWVLNPQ